MASEKIAAGTTINVTIPLTQPIANYENVLLALYTNPAYSFKFSVTEKAGYGSLTQGANPSTLVAKLTSANTGNMSGELYMELRLVDEVGADENTGNSIPTLVGLNIINNVLKSVV